MMEIILSCSSNIIKCSGTVKLMNHTLSHGVKGWDNKIEPFLSTCHTFKDPWWTLHPGLGTTVQACDPWMPLSRGCTTMRWRDSHTVRLSSLLRVTNKHGCRNVLHEHFGTELSLGWLILNSSPSKQGNWLYQNMTQKRSQSLHKLTRTSISAPCPWH